MGTQSAALVLALALLSFGCLGESQVTTTVPTTTNAPTTQPPTIDPVLEEAGSHLAQIETDDSGFRKMALAIARDCEDADKECQLNAVYRYIVENFEHYSDAGSEEPVQTPDETLDLRGGKSEDLSILLNTYLENLGIETYLLLTDTHSYSLACGVDNDKLFKSVYGSLVGKFAQEHGKNGTYEILKKDDAFYFIERYTQTFSLNPLRTHYYGGDGSYFKEPFKKLNIEYSVSSSIPLTLYVVPSRTDWELFESGNPFRMYPECQNYDTYSLTDSCDEILQDGGIVLKNSDWHNKADVSYELMFYYEISVNEMLHDLLVEEGVPSYAINGEDCIVLDVTAGEYGYPGYSGNIKGEKYAINTVTKEQYNLA